MPSLRALGFSYLGRGVSLHSCPSKGQPLLLTLDEYRCGECEITKLVVTTRTIQFSAVQSLSRIRLFATLWTAACQTSLSITNSWNLFKLMSIESVIHKPSHPVFPFSFHLQSFPASGSFPMSHFITSGGQSIGVSASASFHPMNIQDWFPLRWIHSISLQCKGFSRLFSNTTVEKYQLFSAQPSL